MSDPKDGDGSADAKANFRGPEERRLAAALRDVENITRLKFDVFRFPLQNLSEIHDDLLLLTCRVLANDDGLIFPGRGS